MRVSLKRISRASPLIALLGIGLALLVWAALIRGKEGAVIFFLGSGVVLCTLGVSGLRLGKRKASATNATAIIGALIGLLIGGFVGANFGLGPVMISILNPDLPYQDFDTLFGAVGGSILGAFFLALLSGAVQTSIMRAKQAARVEDSEESLPPPSAEP